MSSIVDALTSHTFICSFQREDGIGFSVTNHDRPIAWRDVRAVVDASFRVSEIALERNMVGSRATLRMAANGSAVRPWFMSSDRWLSASVTVEGMQWEDRSQHYVACTGELGGVQRHGDNLVLDVLVTPPALREQPCIETSAECRAKLGDELCRVNMRTRRMSCKVEAKAGAEFTIEGQSNLGRFAFGRLRWLTGRNSGRYQEILHAEGASIRLREPPPSQVDVGDVVLLTEGCDGRLQTCQSRFANVANFRGEPHLPGTDFLLRYPGD